MNNRTLILLSVSLILLLPDALVRSQSLDTGDQKFEAGVQFSTLQTTIPEVIDFSNCTVGTTCVARIGTAKEMQPGFGGRFGYNISNHLTLEAEVNFFPGASSFSKPPAFTGGHKIQGLFGAKVGKRFDKAGIFAKGRPGFLYSSKGDLQLIPGIGCITIVPEPAGCFETISNTSFALDLGGVLEVYPTRRTIIRFDAGDTMVFLKDRRITGDFIPVTGGAPLFVGSITVPSETTHNLQISIGVGFRF